jgi:hypothetical protein
VNEKEKKRRYAIYKPASVNSAQLPWFNAKLQASRAVLLEN